MNHLTVLVTGGTGSFGQAFTRTLLDHDRVDVTSFGDTEGPSYVPGERAVKRVIVFSRDELKQHDMQAAGYTDQRLRFFIGDIRNRDRLRRAMQGVDVVVHAAALKQVPACEYNPLEAVATNIQGTANVIDAALDAGVGRVLMLSSDKAVDPTNLYGATKLVAEKLIVDANVYSGASGPLFAATRYGNVIGSRGSVLPLFQAQLDAGKPLTVTDRSMTRFVLTLEQGVQFVHDCLEVMLGGEVFVPKLPAVTLQTIACSLPGGVMVKEIGRRPGEKMHELLISQHEAHRTIDREWHYLVKPIHDLGRRWGGTPVPDGFRFGSDTAVRLDVDEFRTLAGLAQPLAVAS